MALLLLIFQEVRTIQSTYLQMQNQKTIKYPATQVRNLEKKVMLSRSGFDIGENASTLCVQIMSMLCESISL